MKKWKLEIKYIDESEFEEVDGKLVNIVITNTYRELTHKEVNEIIRNITANENNLIIDVKVEGE